MTILIHDFYLSHGFTSWILFEGAHQFLVSYYEGGAGFVLSHPSSVAIVFYHFFLVKQ